MTTTCRTVLILGVWGTALILAPLVGLAAGTYEHARATGKRCATCHTSLHPDADNLNETGRFFLLNRRLPEEGELPGAAAPPGKEEDGGAIYRRACAACHGTEGKGTPLARSLLGALTHGESTDRLRDVVRRGVPGTTMAAFEDLLSPAQIERVVKHVIDLRKRPSRD